MKRSIERILTTHTGSLPRPGDLTTMLYAQERGELQDQAAFEARVRTAVSEVARKQIESGIDVINDGEMSKISFSTYGKDRLTGFEGEGSMPMNMLPEAIDFPEYMERFFRDFPLANARIPACTGPITYRDKEAVRKDIENFKAALQGVKPEDTFLTAASPGVISLAHPDQHYGSHEAYILALAEAMREEYQAIYEAGLLLQLDCPDLTAGPWADVRLELHVEALNHAVAGISPDRMRLHLCWGNYEGPHHRDVPLKDILDIVLKARPSGLSFEAANPRHEHEWKVFQEVKLPEGKVLIPGMLDSTTNYIEHPELVADRICRFAQVVGRENVIAGDGLWVCHLCGIHHGGSQGSLGEV